MQSATFDQHAVNPAGWLRGTDIWFSLGASAFAYAPAEAGGVPLDKLSRYGRIRRPMSPCSDLRQSFNRSVGDVALRCTEEE